MKRKYRHIKFETRGEGIIFDFGEKQVEIWSTWINGRRIYLDSLANEDLTVDEKIRFFHECVDFINDVEKEKPIIAYNVDLKDSNLWTELCLKLESKIGSVETTTTAKEEKALYKSMYDDLMTGKTTYEIGGKTLKSIQDLDEYWKSRP